MRIQRRMTLIGTALLLIAVGGALLTPDAPLQAEGRAAPEFTHREPGDWINSPPLSLSELRGQVVLLDVWTFDCWNCYRSFPWLNDLEERLAPLGLRVIGVHSPEFKHEHERSAVERKVAEFGLRHPVVLDNDFSYWRALGNSYWPAFYAIDKKGRLRATFVGETHIGDSRAGKIEALLRKLLAEAES